jgi:hypothetical protein
MRFLLSFFILLSFTQNSFASGGVGNGEGLGEQRVTTLNEYLPSYLDFCLKGGCSFNPAEIAFGQLILKTRKQSVAFKFLSGKKNPGYFNNPLEFRTLNTAGSLVTVNIDTLYVSANGTINALAIEEVMKLIVNIYDYQSHELVQPGNFSRKLSMAASRFISSTEHSFNYNYLRVSQFKSSELFHDNLFVSDSENSVNLGAVIREKLKCQNISFSTAFWSPDPKNFAVFVNASAKCSNLSGLLKLFIPLNLKNMAGYWPGSLERMRIPEENSVGEIKQQ